MNCNPGSVKIRVMSNNFFAFFLILGIVWVTVGFGQVSAKTLPRRVSAPGKAVKRANSASFVAVSARLRPDRRALNVYFANLNQAASVTYTLSYQANGNQEGIGGSIDTKGVYSTSRELVFGTASSGVYRYHSNITGARLEVISVLKSGKKAVKRFKIRV